MFKRLIRVFVLCTLFAFSHSLELSNSETNFLFSVKDNTAGQYFYDYNRFRTEINEQSDTFSWKGIFDLETFMGEQYLKSASYLAARQQQLNLPLYPYLYLNDGQQLNARLYLYRLYGTWQNGPHNLTLGIQRIPFGVGRLWNPTDRFNPVNALSIEKEERLGVFGLNYTYYSDNLSYLQLLTNLDNFGAIDKYGLRYKSHFSDIDAAFSYIMSDSFNMNGLELEGNLLNTGMEVRSEIGYFNDYANNNLYVRGILGFDYGFPNMVSLAVEYYYNGSGADNILNYNSSTLTPDNPYLGRHYLGVMLSYMFDPLSTISTTGVLNILDSSFFTGLTLSRSLNDNLILNLGASLFNGSSGSEFSTYSGSYFLQIAMFF
ncbi:MAG: hypothetical protein PHV30_10510 [Candidatus Margulisbacteria bacterium]|nr:hypothetical protein [Candidatus Margulisiibacteriota bacterium]